MIDQKVSSSKNIVKKGIRYNFYIINFKIVIIEVMNFIKNNTPITICDIGSSPCDPTPHLEELLKNTNSFLYGFEPNPEEYNKLKLLELDGNKEFFEVAIGDGSEKILNICSYPGWTSFLEADTQYIKNFHNFEAASKIIDKITLKTKKLDDIPFKNEIDFFKIDTQGYESVIIEHGLKSLSNALVVQVEVSPIPIYKGEKNFSFILNQLENLNYNLNMFYNINTRTFKPMIIGGNSGNGLKTIFQMDCVFVKNFNTIDSFDEEKLKKLILIMFFCYKSYDFVDFLICKLDNLLDTNFINEYRNLMPSFKIIKNY